MIAARHCHVEVVKTLIDQRADLLAMTKRDVTSLHMAVEVCASDGCEKALEVIDILLIADQERRDDLLSETSFGRSDSIGSHSRRTSSVRADSPTKELRRSKRVSDGSEASSGDLPSVLAAAEEENGKHTPSPLKDDDDPVPEHGASLSRSGTAPSRSVQLGTLTMSPHLRWPNRPPFG